MLAAAGGTIIMGRWHFALLIPERFFSPVVYRRGVTAPHSISSTGAFLLRRPYSVPFSILRKRLKPKVHPKFSRSHEYSTVFASIRGVIRMNIPLEQNACMQELHMCNVCRQTLIIYALLTIAKRKSFHFDLRLLNFCRARYGVHRSN